LVLWPAIAGIVLAPWPALVANSVRLFNLAHGVPVQRVFNVQEPQYRARVFAGSATSNYAQPGNVSVTAIDLTRDYDK